MSYCELNGGGDFGDALQLLRCGGGGATRATLSLTTYRRRLLACAHTAHIYMLRYQPHSVRTCFHFLVMPNCYQYVRPHLPPTHFKVQWSGLPQPYLKRPRFSLKKEFVLHTSLLLDAGSCSRCGSCNICLILRISFSSSKSLSLPEF